VCDTSETEPGTGWRGWNTGDGRMSTPSAGDWIDLTWPLTPDVPRLASFPPPAIGRVASLPEQPFNVTELSMVVHVGTHVDSPRHFFVDGPALEDIPLTRLMGTGVVWQLDKPLEATIEPEDLEGMGPGLEPGDILLLDTGAASYVGTPDYHRHPSLSTRCAQWLVDKQVKLLGVDASTPELPFSLRPSGFDWPVHHTLLRDGVLIAEQVANLRALAGHRVELVLLPLNIVGGDGAPARVLGRRSMSHG
jgi:kynurenine formamidase